MPQRTTASYKLTDLPPEYATVSVHGVTRFRDGVAVEHETLETCERPAGLKPTVPAGFEALWGVAVPMLAHSLPRLPDWMSTDRDTSPRPPSTFQPFPTMDGQTHRRRCKHRIE
eukprot:7215985-Prymnesium_polylepis.1